VVWCTWPNQVTKAAGGTTLTDQIGRPAYQKIADELREQIAAGDLPVGAAVPSTAQLSSRYKVSVTVVRAAIRELREEGLVIGQPGKAVYVKATPEHVATERVQLEGVAAEVKQLRAELADVTREVDAAAIEELRRELDELRRHVGTVQAHLIDLYARVGQRYPHDDRQAATGPAADSTRNPRRSGGTEATG
jgi:DNA-binding transcriptional regulator YhcF (GntR family)